MEVTVVQAAPPPPVIVYIPSGTQTLSPAVSYSAQTQSSDKAPRHNPDPPPKPDKPRKEVFVVITVEDYATVQTWRFTDASIRRQFIRKVYSILLVQLSFTLAVILLFTYNYDVNQWACNVPGIFWMALVVALVTLVVMGFCENIRRKTPVNYIFLALFTIAESFMLGIFSARFTDGQVLFAVTITAAVCLIISLFALQSRFDFTMMGGFLLAMVVVLFMFTLLIIFFPGRRVMLFYTSLGALVFCMYLIYDTQLMIGQEHRYAINPEDYVFAALSLYIDIVQILFFVLAIVAMNKA